MRRAFVATAVLIAAAVAAALSYQAAARERDYRDLLGRGDAALREDQTFSAIEAYSGALALRPDSMIAYLRRAETYRRRGDAAKGDLEAAARDLRTAASLDPSAPRPLDELGDVLYELHRYDRAADAYERELRLDDRAAAVAVKLGLARYRQGNLADAAAAARQALALDSTLADAHYVLGICQRDQHRPREAQRSLERAIELAPASVAAREELADVYASLGRRNEELEQLQHIAGLDRARVDRQVALGLAYARAGRSDLAVTTLSAAVERAADPAPAYAALGRVWLQRYEARNERVELSKALEALERVSTSTAATSESLTLYGRALLLDGESDVAERILERATTRYPLDPAAFTFFAQAAELQGHLDVARQALADYDKLVGEDKDFQSRAMRIASLSLRLADPDTAVEWLRRASTANPADTRLLALLADALRRAGDRAGAVATVRKGLEKDPSSPALQALAERLHAR